PKGAIRTALTVECMRRPMLNNSEAGELVYDPFLGSGTTWIAAEVTGRVCVAIELDPIYVDVAIRRWEAFTGRKAMLEGERGSFEEVAIRRGEQPMPPEKMGSEGEVACAGDDQSLPA